MVFRTFQNLLSIIQPSGWYTHSSSFPNITFSMVVLRLLKFKAVLGSDSWVSGFASSFMLKFLTV